MDDEFGNEGKVLESEELALAGSDDLLDDEFASADEELADHDEFDDED